MYIHNNVNGQISLHKCICTASTYTCVDAINTCIYIYVAYTCVTHIYVSLFILPQLFSFHFDSNTWYIMLTQLDS